MKHFDWASEKGPRVFNISFCRRLRKCPTLLFFFFGGSIVLRHSLFAQVPFVGSPYHHMAAMGYLFKVDDVQGMANTRVRVKENEMKTTNACRLIKLFIIPLSSVVGCNLEEEEEQLQFQTFCRERHTLEEELE